MHRVSETATLSAPRPYLHTRRGRELRRQMLTMRPDDGALRGVRVLTDRDHSNCESSELSLCREGQREPARAAHHRHHERDGFVLDLSEPVVIASVAIDSRRCREGWCLPRVPSQLALRLPRVPAFVACASDLREVLPENPRPNVLPCERTRELTELAVVRFVRLRVLRWVYDTGHGEGSN